MSTHHLDQALVFDYQNDSSLSSCSSPKASHLSLENDSGCGSDEDPSLALKINKGLSMGYDYELIKSVIEQQNDGDDMSKFIETIVRTAEVNSNSITPPPSTTTDSDCSDTSLAYDVYIIDGADLAYSYDNQTFSWRGIEICLKYLHSHGHKKVFVAFPYTLKQHRHDQSFSETKSLRDLERKNLLVYTNRTSKQTHKPSSYTHINEMLKFSHKTKGYLITNVSLKDVILDFTIYKQILEEKVIRYRFQNDHFQPLLVTIVNNDQGNDRETHYPLCPYGRKCTYGLKCKYFHLKRRQVSSHLVSDSLQSKSTQLIPTGFNHTKSSPDHLHMYSSPPMFEQSLVDDARTSYEYGLTSTPNSNDFSFVDQRLSYPTPYSPANRSFSMPHPQQINDMNAAMIMQQQQFEQNVLRFLSMLSLQPQPITNSIPHPTPENHFAHSSVNSQQGLADNIQGVRHLWESESQSPPSVSVDSTVYNSGLQLTPHFLYHNQ